MNPIILERDSQIIDWQTHLTGWPLLDIVTNSTTIRGVNDGLIYTEHGVADVSKIAGLTDLTHFAIGVNMAGPEVGEEYTPYQINVAATAENCYVNPFVFVGESIAAPTTDADGDLITDIRIIKGAETSHTAAASLNCDTIVVMIPNTADRALFFGVGMAALSATSGTMRAHIAVRRLIGVNPTIIDSRKL